MRFVGAALALPCLLLLASSCGSYSRAELDVGPAQTACASTDPRVGTDALLKGYAHGVSGRAVIVDDCTIELRELSFDGGGLDVRAIGATDGDYGNGGTILTQDLRRPGGYDKETVRIPLPEGVALDDVLTLSLWCVPAAANLGDADLSP